MKARPRCDRWRALHHDVASDTWWRWMPAPDALWHIPRALARLARLQRREIERLREALEYEKGRSEAERARADYLLEKIDAMEDELEETR